MSSKERFLTVFDEINRLIPTSYITAIENSEDMPDAESRKKKIADDIIEDLLSILINAYTEGVADISETFGADIDADMDDMYDAIYFVWGDGKTFEDRIREHVENGNAEAVIRVAETEAHRDYSAGQADSIQNGRASGAIASDLTIMKRWNTMRDPKVRETHEYLESMVVPADDDFYTFDGDHAPYPGAFEKTENNANCRCLLTYEAV